MKDKKDYTALLKIIGKSASAQVVLNKLVELFHDTEDVHLKKHIQSVATLFKATAKGSKLTVCLANAVPAQFPVHMDLPKAISEAVAYCHQCISSIEPQWQILARQAGWTPPGP